MAHATPLPIRKVRIVNPLSGPGITSRKSAERFVSRGLAIWISAQSIRMIEDDHRRQSAKTAARINQQAGYDRCTHGDRPGPNVRDELKHIPVICGYKLLWGRREDDFVSWRCSVGNRKKRLDELDGDPQE